MADNPVASFFRFRIVPDHGEPYEVQATARDVLAWEKAKPGRSFSTLMATMAMVDLYQVAFAASKRTGRWPGTQREFEELCDLDWDEPEQREPGGQEPDPTQPAR